MSADPAMAIGLLLYAVVGVGVFAVTLLVSRAVARRWGGSKAVRALLWSASSVPAAAVILAVALFLRVRERYGEWPTSLMLLRFDRDEPYFEPLHEGLTAHMLVAQLLYLLAICSVVVVPPFVIGLARERRPIRLPAAFYGFGYLVLMTLYVTDPHGTMHWLLD